MLICYKNFQGGLNLNVGGVNIRLSGYGLIDNVDETLYQRAKQIYPFLNDWEQNGIIEVNQKERKDSEAFEAEIKKQDEAIAKSEATTKTKITRKKKAE